MTSVSPANSVVCPGSRRSSSCPSAVYTNDVVFPPTVIDAISPWSFHVMACAPLPVDGVRDTMSPAVS